MFAANKLTVFLFLSSIAGYTNSLPEVVGGSDCVVDKLFENDVVISQEIHVLTTVTKYLVAEKEEVNSTVQQLKSGTTQLTSDLEEVETKIEQLNDRILNLQGNNHQPVKSAFSAYMTIGHFEPNNSTDIVVPMNGVNLNMNGDYNSQTSTYTCPVSGVYYFSYAVYSSGVKESSDNRVYAFLAVDGKLQNEVHCQTETTEYIYCQATSSITIHCNHGDPVQVKTNSASTKNQIYGTSNYKRTTFTGHLLYADNVDV